MLIVIRSLRLSLVQLTVSIFPRVLYVYHLKFVHPITYPVIPESNMHLGIRQYVRFSDLRVLRTQNSC